MTKILVVEDEPTLRETLAFNLERDGYEVAQVADGRAAVDYFQLQHNAQGGGIDLVLLDVMLPQLSGTEVCRAMRAKSNVPIIMLTAKDSEIDKVVGLELGADDYVTKPYSYRELLARIRALLRRSAQLAADLEDDVHDVLEAGALRLDPEAHEVTLRGEPIQMPLREFELLEYLMENVDRVLTRSQILDRIWSLDYVGDTKTLDVHVKRLRSKIEDDPGNPRRLLTVRGLGYKLVREAAAGE